MITIGITGTIGAGKGVIVSYLESKGFVHYSVRGYLIDILNKRGTPIRRDTMTDLADELRRDHEPSYIIEQLYDIAHNTGQDSIIESIRALGEVEYLKKQGGFYLLSVDADEKVRYDRILVRSSELDHVSFERFVADNEREMASVDPSRGNIAGCMELADFKVRNDGSIEELHKEIDKVLEIIRRSSSVGRASLS